MIMGSWQKNQKTAETFCLHAHTPPKFTADFTHGRNMTFLAINS